MASDRLRVNVDRLEGALIGREVVINAVWGQLSGSAETSVPPADAVLFSGLPGIGKRSLASVIAHRALETEEGTQAFPRRGCGGNHRG